jgi:hypothetical protein
MVRESNHEKDNEQLWWVQYVAKQDLERQAGSTPEPEHAFFYAIDEPALHKRLADWSSRVMHDGVVIQGIEQVPLGFNLRFIPGLLQELPEGARLLTLQETTLA